MQAFSPRESIFATTETSLLCDCSLPQSMALNNKKKFQIFGVGLNIYFNQCYFSDNWDYPDEC